MVQSRVGAGAQSRSQSVFFLSFLTKPKATPQKLAHATTLSLTDFVNTCLQAICLSVCVR